MPRPYGVSEPEEEGDAGTDECADKPRKAARFRRAGRGEIASIDPALRSCRLSPDVARVLRGLACNRARLEGHFAAHRLVGLETKVDPI